MRRDAIERELADVTERLADPSIYADASRVRQLVARHNELRDAQPLATAEAERLTAELVAASEGDSAQDPALVRR